MIMGGFQEDLVTVFGANLGWLVGHLIIVGVLALSVITIRDGEKILKHSGMGREMALDIAIFLILSLFLYYLFTSTYSFESTPSIFLAGASSLFVRWMVRVLG